jgi:tRNA pseudouridine38-40 synthase
METQGEDAALSLRRYRLTVAYDGTRYAGWQRQPNGISVQETLEQAAARLVAPLACRMHGSGRTDAGVHARGQVVHFEMAREIAPVKLRRALNGVLPPDVQVLEAAEAVPDFDARRSALGKEYRYFVWNAEVLTPDRRLYAAHIRNPMDLEAVRDAAARFVGKHDFAAFSANPNREVASTVREVFSVEVLQDGPLVAFHVQGDGFLYKMVRSMAGFLMAVGIGKEKPEAVDDVLASRVRTSRVESAPPQGLFLWRVWYPDPS